MNGRQSLQWYINHWCLLADVGTCLRLFYMRTGGYPCEECFRIADCQLRHQRDENGTLLIQPRPAIGASNAQIAQMLGISKRQVARLRRDGKLAAALAEIE